YGQRILVVEDEEDVKEMVADVLRENGYTVFTASNAREALEIFEVEEGAIDLVFTDVILPDIHGPELVKRLMLRNPQLRVLFCSGYMQEHSEGREVQEKGLPFIQKPFSVLGMLQAVRNALESPPPSLE
ncbi:MAG TPA: response regulator, partial [Chloroflexi bacterium]|nr:response regulator [Chloroflexota bacterium]